MNEIEQKEDQADCKQQAKGLEQGANFFMDAFEADYESNKDEYGIVCTQTFVTTSVMVDYKRISVCTAHLFKQDHQMIQNSWLLLDDCSIINIICNLHLVTNIHEVNQRCIISTNASIGSTNLKTTLKSNILPIKEEVSFDYNGIAIIIALHSVQDHFKVSYSNWFSSDRNAFVVIKPDNTKMKFTMSRKGLYYTDTSNLIGQLSKAGVFNQVASVEENLTKYYTQRSADQAKAAQRFQVMFNNISTPKLLNIVNKNLVKGLHITREDVKRADEIYGPNVYALKGKTTNRKINHVIAPITEIPKEILKEYKNITLCIDIMFINGIKFLLTVSRNIDFLQPNTCRARSTMGTSSQSKWFVTCMRREDLLSQLFLLIPNSNILRLSLTRVVDASDILSQTVTQLNQPSTSLPRTNTSKKQKERFVLSRKALDQCDLPFPCSVIFPKC